MKKPISKKDIKLQAELERAHQLIARTRLEARLALIRAMALASGVQTRPASICVVGLFVTDLPESSGRHVAKGEPHCVRLVPSPKPDCEGALYRKPAE
jgi:hypothetical protein